MINYFKSYFYTFSIFAVPFLCSTAYGESMEEMVIRFDYSVKNELIRLEDFQEIRQDVINHGIDTLVGFVPTEEEPTDTITTEATHDTSQTENVEEQVPEYYAPTLKERRQANHDKWRLMTEKDKEEFFKDLPPEAEERLNRRREFLRSRLGLRPKRGNDS